MTIVYVNQLSDKQQEEISDELENYLLQEGYLLDEIKEAIENAMNSKLHDLENVIDINKYKGRY